MSLDAIVLARAEEQMRSPESWRSEPGERRDLCLYGHPLDGEASSGGGRRTRYCKTCRKAQRDRRRDRAAQTAGLAPAFEEE